MPYEEEVPTENDETDIEFEVEENSNNILSHNKAEVTQCADKKLISGSICVGHNSLYVGDEVTAECNIKKIEEKLTDIVKTGDFAERDAIKRNLIIQAIALLVILLIVKKDGKKEGKAQKGKM